MESGSPRITWVIGMIVDAQVHGKQKSSTNLYHFPNSSSIWLPLYWTKMWFARTDTASWESCDERWQIPARLYDLRRDGPRGSAVETKVGEIRMSIYSVRTGKELTWIYHKQVTTVKPNLPTVWNQKWWLARGLPLIQTPKWDAAYEIWSWLGVIEHCLSYISYYMPFLAFFNKLLCGGLSQRKQYCPFSIAVRLNRGPVLQIGSPSKVLPSSKGTL